MSDTTRVGVLGVQHEEHTRGFIESITGGYAGAEIVAIAERDELYRRDHEGRAGVTLYADYAEMLDREQLDAAFVDTINSEKAAAACACLERGVAVLVNKPLCTTLDQLDNLADTILRYAGLLSLQLTERFNPVFVALKSAIVEGLIGVPVAFQAAKPHRLSRPGAFKHGRPRWMFDPNAYGGVLVDLGVHDVDLVRWLSGAEVESVLAVTGMARFGTAHPGFTDHGQLFLRLAGERSACIEVDWLHPENSGQVRFVVHGTHGVASFDGQLGPGELVRIVQDSRTVTLKGYGANSFLLQAHAFLDSVRARSVAEPSPRDALMATLVTLCGRESAERGVLVDITSHPLFAKIQSLPGR